MSFSQKLAGVFARPLKEVPAYLQSEFSYAKIAPLVSTASAEYTAKHFGAKSSITPLIHYMLGCGTIGYVAGYSAEYAHMKHAEEVARAKAAGK